MQNMPAVKSILGNYESDNSGTSFDKPRGLRDGGGIGSIIGKA